MATLQEVIQAYKAKGGTDEEVQQLLRQNLETKLMGQNKSPGIGQVASQALLGGLQGLTGQPITAGQNQNDQLRQSLLKTLGEEQIKSLYKETPEELSNKKVREQVQKLMVEDEFNRAQSRKRAQQSLETVKSLGLPTPDDSDEIPAVQVIGQGQRDPNQPASPFVNVVEYEIDDYGNLIPNIKTKDNPEFLSPEDRRKQEEDKKLSKREEEKIRLDAEDMLDTIQNVKSGKDFFGFAGDVPTLLSPSTYIPGGYTYSDRAKWEANFDKLKSQRILDVMSELKRVSKTGATGFGALQEKELKVLTDASTALRKNLSPEDALVELNKIENITRKVLGMPLINPNKKEEQIDLGDGFILRRVS